MRTSKAPPHHHQQQQKHTKTTSQWQMNELSVWLTSRSWTCPSTEPGSTPGGRASVKRPVQLVIHISSSPSASWNWPSWSKASSSLCFRSSPFEWSWDQAVLSFSICSLRNGLSCEEQLSLSFLPWETVAVILGLSSVKDTSNS